MSSRTDTTEVGTEPHAPKSTDGQAADAMVIELGSILRAWEAAVVAQVPGLELFDAHTHLGQNDPDGMSQRTDELLSGIADSGAKGAFVFPMHEPDGYPAANDMVLEAASTSEAGQLLPFCRVNPHDGAVAEAERCLAAGARGIKLHPRAEQFTLDHPAVAELAALAHERRLPVLIHAGRGIPALGAHAVELAARFPEARLILAHAGICDLSWIWRAAPDHPNLLFDTAWWMPTDLLTLFTLVPPGQVVFASDSPYGNTLMSASFQLRLAIQAGLSDEQIRSIASGQALRLARREPLLPAGSALGEREQAPHVLLDRLAQFVLLATIQLFRGGDAAEMLALARLACDVPPEIDDAPVFAAVLRLLDQHERLAAATDPADRRPRSLLILAASAARTPAVALPALD
jgi:predicted TIM-barrel fold metal-dependent hydrolase